MLASAYWQRKEIDLAINEATEAVRLTPNDALRHFKLGNFYGKKGLLNKAIQEYEQAVSFKPRDTMFLYNLGEAYWKSGMFKQALTTFKKVLKVGDIYREMAANQNIKFIEAGVPYVERYSGIPDERYVTIDKKDPYIMALAVGHYRAKEKKEPANLEELVGTYIAKVRKDGWGTPYKLDSNKNAIVSAGKDKRFGTKDDEVSYPIPKIRISEKPLVKTYGEVTVER